MKHIFQRYLTILLVFSAIFYTVSCQKKPLHQGQSFLQRPVPFKFASNLPATLNPIIDTSIVYVMRMVKCPDCSNGLRISRHVSEYSCQLDVNCSRLNDDYIIRDSAGFNVKAPIERKPESTLYLKFIDEKRVIYGSVKSDHLPSAYNMERMPWRFQKKAKMARGYYAIEKDQVYMRMQHLRTRKEFDMVFSINPENTKELTLKEVITYDAADADVNSDKFQKTFRVSNLFSYSMVFDGSKKQYKLPLENYERPCCDRNGDCATW